MKLERLQYQIWTSVKKLEKYLSNRTSFSIFCKLVGLILVLEFPKLLNKSYLKGSGAIHNQKTVSIYNHGQNIWDKLLFSCEIGNYGKSSISVIHKFLASIDRMSILGKTLAIILWSFEIFLIFPNFLRFLMLFYLHIYFKSICILFWSLSNDNYLLSSVLHLFVTGDNSLLHGLIIMTALLLYCWGTFKCNVLCPASHIRISVWQKSISNGGI